MKVTGGLVLVGVGGFILIDEGVSAVSSEAVVNARVAVVRAPIDGRLRLEPRTVGQRVRAGTSLGSLTDERADEARVLDLERIAEQLEGEIVRLRAQTAAIESSRINLDARAKSYHEGRIRQLRAQVDEAVAITAAAEARVRDSDAALIRAKALKTRGYRSDAALDQVTATNSVAMLELKAASARVERLRIELAAAMTGTFLGDSYNDTPYSSQRIQELDLRLDELRAEIAERQRRLDKVRDQIAVERQRFARMYMAFLDSPVTGTVWEAPLGDGEYARKGQDVLRLLDCSTTIVTAGVGERDYNNLRVGDRARFRLSGTSRVFDATVLRLAGSGAAAVYANLAVAPGPKHLERFDVALEVPGLVADPEAGCAVGRTGKVVLSGGWRDLGARLAALVGL
ncbi:MAG TPA: HlyD family efflux transporter periplasmic adaptor subunit [Arenibaculum sp.]|nr:HlyD family efflux transporter periplasmic adaptor subunit [Arenibaculum sp.]